MPQTKIKCSELTLNWTKFKSLISILKKSFTEAQSGQHTYIL